MTNDYNIPDILKRSFPIFDYSNIDELSIPFNISEENDIITPDNIYEDSYFSDYITSYIANNQLNQKRKDKLFKIKHIKKARKRKNQINDELGKGTHDKYSLNQKKNNAFM